jgi:hypothetical protein
VTEHQLRKKMAELYNEARAQVGQGKNP